MSGASKLQIDELLNIQLPLELDQIYLERGMWGTVEINELDFRGDNASILQAQINLDDFVDYQVYQSRNKNWIYESDWDDSAYPMPTIVPQVTVNGSIQSPALYDVDYLNGRIIFSTPLSDTDEVKASYAYKHVFSTETTDTLELLIQSDKENIVVDTDLIYPSEREVIMPAVFVDTSVRESRPMCIGTSGKIFTDTVNFNVYAEDKRQIGRIVDGLSYFEDRPIKIIDWLNVQPLFNDFGDINPAAGTFNEYKVTNHLYTSYMRDVIVRKLPKTDPFHRAVVQATIETWIPFTGLTP